MHPSAQGALRATFPLTLRTLRTGTQDALRAAFPLTLRTLRTRTQDALRAAFPLLGNCLYFVHGKPTAGMEGGRRDHAVLYDIGGGLVIGYPF